MSDEAASESVRDRLRRTRGRVQWSDLRAHSEREALFLVNEVELLEVAVAVAEDDIAAVQNWISGGQLVRPSRAQLEAWGKLDEKPFESIVVQPYALAREV